MRILRALAGGLAFCACAAQAQDLSVQVGGARIHEPVDNTYAWLISYSHDLGPSLFASLTYQNEGHVPGHHRDGHALQIGARTSVFSPRLTLAASVGPYHYFDTTAAETPQGFADVHGWGVMYSLSATWRPEGSRWFYRARVNHVDADHNIDTTTLLLGAGYALEQDGSFRSNTAIDWKRGDDELVVMAGQTIVNSLESQSAIAKSFEYRRSFTPALRGSIGWLNEGDARLIRRDGVVAQAWFEPSFYRDRFTLGVGYGAYFAVDEYHSERHRVQGILGTTFSYHFAGGLLARATWQRIVSDYDRDSDILLVGVGYRF